MSIIDRFESGTFFGWTLKQNFSLFVQNNNDFQLLTHQTFHRENPVGAIGFKFDVNALDVDDLIAGIYKIILLEGVNLVEVPIWKSVIVSHEISKIDLNALKLYPRNLSRETAFNFQNYFNYNFNTSITSNIKKKNICLLTYANGSGAWFDYFFNFYKKMIPSCGLVVVTPNPNEFSDYDIDTIFSLDGFKYDDEARARFLSSLQSSLLNYFEWTLLVDVDEIVMPDPRLNINFTDALNLYQSQSVIYSIGVDLIEFDNNQVFDFSKNPYENRPIGIVNSSLGKPVLAKVPVTYIPGHHYCNFPPVFDSPLFFNFHLKYASKVISADLMNMVKKIEYTSDFIRNYAISPSINFTHPAYSKNMKIIDLDDFDLSIYFSKFISEAKFSSRIFNINGPTFCLPNLIKFPS
jgi:hypothetical protein